MKKSKKCDNQFLENVCGLIESRRYKLASCIGMKTSISGLCLRNNSSIGLLLPPCVYSKRKRKKFIGVIYLDNPWHNANRLNLVFDVYGKTYLKWLESLAEDIKSSFYPAFADIKLNLKRNYPRAEVFESDLINRIKINKEGVA